MSVITISREFGSGGDVLAERVAEALGYHLVDKAFISAVLHQYGIVEFDEEYEKQPGFWEDFDVAKSERRSTMVHLLNQLVRAVARHGNVVILGRSGYAILSGLADVLHVRLQAPLEDRIEMVRQGQTLSPDAATALVNEKDRIRTSFIESFYHVPWEASHAFDIAINTAIVPIELATRWVIEAAGSRSPSPSTRLSTRQIDVDPVMQHAVAEKLNCLMEHA